MALSKQTFAWLKVYVFFPVAPVVIETGLRIFIHGKAFEVMGIPAYSTALVSIMAISIFLHDELNRTRILNPDEEMSAELIGNRYTMILFFFFACVLFCAIILLSLVNESVRDEPAASPLISQLEILLNVCRMFAVAIFIIFVRAAIQMQRQYKLAVA